MYTWKLEKADGGHETGPAVSTEEKAMRSAEGHFVRGVGQVAMEYAEGPEDPEPPLTLEELPAQWNRDANRWTWVPSGWEWTYTVVPT